MRVAIAVAAFVAASAAGALAADAPTFVNPVHHPVSTTNAAAQADFDEGLLLVYAFNRVAAEQAFASAAAADPSLAMAYWGEALALGPNLNFDMKSGSAKKALADLDLAKAHLAGASDEERALVAALGARYSTDLKLKSDKLEEAYSAKMAAVNAAYPDDLDVAALYAESILNGLGPEDWKGGVPTPPMAKLVALLADIRRVDPDHIGANHYTIHAYDWSPYPERGLDSANRLSNVPLEPAASHLTHMGGHIFMRTGEYEKLEHYNELAVEDDRAYAASIGGRTADLDYYNHNLMFMTIGAVYSPDRDGERRALDYLAAHDAYAARSLVALAEGRYDDVLSATSPAGAAPLFLTDFDFAKTVAFYARHLPAEGARSSLAFENDVQKMSAPMRSRLADSERTVIRAAAAREAGDTAAEMTALAKAADAIDASGPENPLHFLVPARLWLGEEQLRLGMAEKAEASFRVSLEIVRRSPWAMLGLERALEARGDHLDAAYVARELDDMWKGNEGAIRLEDF